MSSTLAFLIAFGALLGLILVRVPVGFSLLVSGALGLFLVRGASFAGSSLATGLYGAVSSYSLLLVPMFLLMSMFVVQAKIADDVFSIASRTLGRIRGGLGLATVAASAGFAAVTGSSVATVATVGRVAIERMRAYGYAGHFATGIVAAGGTLGVLIPPSIILVMYGIITGESIGMLLAAGIVPGVVSALLYGFVVVVWSKRYLEAPESVASDHGSSMGAQGPAQHEGRLLDSPKPIVSDDRGHVTRKELLAVVKIAILIGIVLGGVYGGQVTVTESGGVAAFVALLIALLARREGLRFGALREAVRSTTAASGMIFLLLIGGAVFSTFMVAARIPQQLAAALASLDYPGWMIITLILLAMVPLGMFLDSLSILLIVVPLVFPTVIELGYSGIWFGIMVVKMIEFGMITPPLGLNVYVASGLTPDISIEQTFRGIIPFAVTDAVTVVLFFAVPGLVLYLPGMIS